MNQNARRNSENQVLCSTSEVSEKKMSSASAIVQETEEILSPLVGQPFLGHLVVFFG